MLGAERLASNSTRERPVDMAHQRTRAALLLRHRLTPSVSRCCDFAEDSEFASCYPARAGTSEP